MKSRYISRIPVIICLFAIVATAFHAYSKKSTWDNDAAKRKASYLYIQAIDAFADEKYNLYGELITRAHQLDPNDLEIRSRYGEWQLMTNDNDTNVINESFASIIKAYKEKPADYYEGMQLINLTSNYRRWDDMLTVSKILHKQFPDRNEVTLQLGRSFLMRAYMGDTAYINPAIEAFSSLEDKLGKSPQLSELKIAAYSTVRDSAAIFRELDTLNKALPNDLQTALATARIYNNMQKPQMALTYYDRACLIDSTNGNAIIMRAQFLRQQGDSTTFDQEAFRAIESRDLELETKFKLIVDYVNMLDNDSTLQNRIDRLFDRLLDVNPGEPEVHSLYGEYLSHIGKYDRAAEQLQYTTSLEPENKNNWLFMAQLQAMASDYKKAAETIQQVVDRFGDDPELRTAQAAYLMQSDSLKQAISILESTPDSTITDPERKSNFHALMGDLYYQTKQKDKAFKAYNTALKYNPLNYMALNNVAYYYAESDTLLDTAISYVKRALRYEPDNTVYLDTYAWALYKKGHFEKAKEIIKQTICLEVSEGCIDSTDVVIDSILDSVSIKDERIEPKVNEAIEESLIGSADMFDHAGDIYFMSGDIARAVKFWESALKRKPENPAAIKLKIKNRKIDIKDQPKKAKNEP